MRSATTSGEPDDRGLAHVLRRLALDPHFLDAVLDDPLTALAPHRLSADDISALALWLDRRHPGHGVRSLFHGGADERPEASARQREEG